MPYIQDHLNSPFLQLRPEACKDNSIYSKVPRSTPDIILNEDPGKIVEDGQFFLCEMKTAVNSKYYEDFEKLYKFKEAGLNFKEYIFLSIGETIEELENSFQKMVDDYLETCKALGKKPQKVYSGSFNIRTGPQIHQALAEIAELKNISMNKLIIAIFSDFVKDASFQKKTFQHFNFSENKN